jgi:hypothetical protein
MIGRGSLAGRVAAMERAGGAGREVLVVTRIGEPEEAAMLRTFGTQGPPPGARVLLVLTGITRAHDDGVEP